MKTNYTREELITICESAVVPQEKWHDRGSRSAQLGVGKALALLKCGCEFEILTSNYGGGRRYKNQSDIRIIIWVNDSLWFGLPSEDPRLHGEEVSHMLFTIPTPEKLERCSGGDWY